MKSPQILLVLTLCSSVVFGACKDSPSGPVELTPDSVASLQREVFDAYGKGKSYDDTYAMLVKKLGEPRHRDPEAKEVYWYKADEAGKCLGLRLMNDDGKPAVGTVEGYTLEGCE